MISLANMKQTADERFLKVGFSLRNLDIYQARNAIFNEIKTKAPSFKGDLLDIGCGKMPYKEYILQQSQVKNYIGLDIENAIDYGGTKPDFTWNGITMPYGDCRFDCVVATEVLEHCPDPLVTLDEVYRVLKTGGIFFFTVPFLWPLHEFPHDEYRYTPFALERLLIAAGFKADNFKLSALGGWEASLANMLGLWVRRRGLPRFLKNTLSILLMPVIKILLKMDKKPENFNGCFMLTGITGWVQK